IAGLIDDHDGNLVAVLGALIERALDDGDRHRHGDVFLHLRRLGRGRCGSEHGRGGKDGDTDTTHRRLPGSLLLGALLNPRRLRTIPRLRAEFHPARLPQVDDRPALASGNGEIRLTALLAEAVRESRSWP